MSKENRMSLKDTLPLLLFSLDIDLALKKFKKETYFSFLDEYREMNSSVYSEIKEVFDTDENWEVTFKEGADALAMNAKSYIDKKFILTRSRHMIDFAYMVTCFVIPGILDMNDDKCSRACEIISESWSVAFPKLGRIGVATRDEFLSGFKKTILGIPIEK